MNNFDKDFWNDEKFLKRFGINKKAPWRLEDWMRPKGMPDVRSFDLHPAEVRGGLRVHQEKLSWSDETVEKIVDVYRNAVKIENNKDTSSHGLVEACIYAVCRNTKNQLTLEQICEMFDIEKKYVMVWYQILEKEVELTSED